MSDSRTSKVTEINRAAQPNPVLTDAVDEQRSVLAQVRGTTVDELNGIHIDRARVSVRQVGNITRQAGHVARMVTLRHNAQRDTR